MDNKVISSACYLYCALLDLFGIVKDFYFYLILELLCTKYMAGGKPPTIQQLCSCEFNLESNHMFPIKPVMAVWGGDGGRGLVWFYAQFSFQETLFFPFGQITAAQYC